MTDEETIVDLRNERIGLAAQVNDRDMRIAWLKAEVYRLRSNLDGAWRCLNPVGQLARDYIGAAAADGDGWMNLKAQAEAEAKIRASKIRAAQDSAACHANVECMIDAESIDFAEPVRLCPATIVRIGNSLAKSIEPAADAPPVVDAAPAKPPTVADLLRVLSAVEWRGSYGQWCQFSSSLACRQWNGKRWSPWTTFVVSADDEASTARLVPASEADADPATRGPIDGSGGGA